MSAAQRFELTKGHYEPPTALPPPKAPHEFHFTVPDSKFTLEQRQQYERDGFILVRGLVPEADIDKYYDRFSKLCTGEVERPGLNFLVMRDVTLPKSTPLNARTVTKIQHWERDPVLFEYCKHPRVTEVAANIIGPNIMSVHTMLINKPPDTGKGSSRHPLHQDLWYFPFRPADRICAAWTAMQRVDLENGCLWVVPGSHRSELYRHGYPKWEASNKAYHGVLHLGEKTDCTSHPAAVPVIMGKGDTVFFHPLLLHGSGRNDSGGMRTAISVHYAASECFWIDVEGTVQEDIRDEIQEMAATRLGGKLDYVSTWQYAARLARGKEAWLWPTDGVRFAN